MTGPEGFKRRGWCRSTRRSTDWVADVGWAGFWPGAPGPFAKPMNEIPKVVFSNSLASAGWGETTIAAGEQISVGALLLAHGGVRFARSPVETGLIDEYRLVIHPAVAHIFAAHPAHDA